MDNIKLIKPCEEYLDSYLEACREFRITDINSSSLHDPNNFELWKSTIFEKYKSHSSGINLPKGYVSCTTYWLVDDKNIIGIGSIRHSLTDTLRKYGGHIGYMICPKYHNKGYGTLQLELLLENAYELGIEEALLTCDVNNTASARVMEKNGGVRMDQISVCVDSTDKEVYRYTIKTVYT
ncbi:MAG: GNAT family N-acetyltransferase [Clostridiales bacterium]|nr:GNAT family N-acetyltransferase [Clostridiales bacterium]